MRKLFGREVKLPIERELFNALLNGSEGGLATTTAIISGLLVSTSNRELVVTTAFIAFMVQGFNGAISRYSTERTTDEIDHEDKFSGYRKPVFDGAAQLIAHVSMSLLVLLPIIFVADITTALLLSIGTTLAILLIMGIYKARIVNKPIFSDAIEMVILGGLVITVGTVAGYALR